MNGRNWKNPRFLTKSAFNDEPEMNFFGGKILCSQATSINSFIAVVAFKYQVLCFTDWKPNEQLTFSSALRSVQMNTILL